MIFKDLEEHLEDLYAKIDYLIANNEDVLSANNVWSERDGFAFKETNKEQKKSLKNALKQQIF